MNTNIEYDYQDIYDINNYPWWIHLTGNSIPPLCIQRIIFPHIFVEGQTNVL